MSVQGLDGWDEAEAAAFELAMEAEGMDETLPLVLIERALLQTWDLGLPYAVVPGQHLAAATMRCEVPRMPGCGAEHYRADADVTLYCLLEPGHEGTPLPGIAGPGAWTLYKPHGWSEALSTVGFPV